MFEVALGEWKLAAAALADVEGEFARERGKALAVATGKNEAAREGEAEIATKDLRAKRDSARIEEQAARWSVQYQLAKAGKAAAL
jgi:hypothetical protein